MKMKTLFLWASLFGVVGVLGGCACPVNGRHAHHHGKPVNTTETVVVYEAYDVSDINSVTAKMFTRSSRGGESAMGTIKFKETDSGLKMKLDLIDLRPGKTYTMHIYQCGSCNTYACCNETPMALELPNIMIKSAGRLQQSYMLQGLTAGQLNNAKLVLTRDGGYKAAWGKIRK